MYEVTISTFDIDILCFSIASWIVLSWTFILSNSSNKHIPLSDKTNFHPSNVHSFVTESFWTEFFKPTELMYYLLYIHYVKILFERILTFDFFVPYSPNNKSVYHQEFMLVLRVFLYSTIAINKLIFVIFFYWINKNFHFLLYCHI